MLLLTCIRNDLVGRCASTCEQEHQHLKCFVEDNFYLLESRRPLKDLTNEELYNTCYVSLSKKETKRVLQTWRSLGYFIYRLIDPETLSIVYHLAYERNFEKYFKEVK